MRVIKIALAAGLFASNLAFAYDFKGIEVGAKTDLETLRSKLALECINDVTGPGFYCVGNTTIIERKAKLSVFLSHEYIVENISVNFAPAIFDTVKAGLIEKFGKPESDKIQAIQNGMGAIFEQNTVSWGRDDDIMVLTKYRTKVTESELFIASKAAMAQARKSVEKSKGDL